ncbi:flagellar hook-associated protein FlgK [Puniceicoccaceae bacterium K14]|nr:flagellar hook-associated protein FlgK [Puniceicoccaceae bacterium K14]
MGNIFGDLSNATKALNAHRFGVTTAGSNISNVNNPEYSRQQAILGDRGTTMTLEGPVSLGVEVLGFSQTRDAVLDKELLRETSLNSSLTAKSEALQKAEASTGQEISRIGDSAFVDSASGSSSGGFAEVLNDFFNSFHALSANPSSDAEKEALMQEADILTNNMNVTAERFSDLQEDLTFQVETDVAEANALIAQIAELNTEIARAEASHAGQALSLRDERQGRLEDLSELVEIQTEEITGSSGQIRVTLYPSDGGYAVDLVEHGRYSTIEFDNSVEGSPKFFLSDSDNTQVKIEGGSVHGALEARDGAMADYMNQLDNLAEQIVTEINALYSDNGTFSNFFSDTGGANELTAAGISLDSTLSTTTLRTTNDANQFSGDNELILAIAELDEVKFSSLGERTFSSYYRATVSDLAAEVSAVDSQLEDEQVVLDLLLQQRDSVSGVSIDEEMTDMMKFQRAYEATGKLIAAIDEMLDVVINRLI